MADPVQGAKNVASGAWNFAKKAIVPLSLVFAGCIVISALVGPSGSMALAAAAKSSSGVTFPDLGQAALEGLKEGAGKLTDAVNWASSQMGEAAVKEGVASSSATAAPELLFGS